MNDSDDVKIAFDRVYGSDDECDNDFDRAESGNECDSEGEYIFPPEQVNRVISMMQDAGCENIEELVEMIKELNDLLLSEDDEITVQNTQEELNTLNNIRTEYFEVVEASTSCEVTSQSPPDEAIEVLKGVKCDNIEALEKKIKACGERMEVETGLKLKMQKKTHKTYTDARDTYFKICGKYIDLDDIEMVEEDLPPPVMARTTSVKHQLHASDRFHQTVATWPACAEKTLFGLFSHFSYLTSRLSSLYDLSMEGGPDGSTVGYVLTPDELQTGLATLRSQLHEEGFSTSLSVQDTLRTLDATFSSRRMNTIDMYKEIKKSVDVVLSEIDSCFRNQSEKTLFRTEDPLGEALVKLNGLVASVVIRSKGKSSEVIYHQSRC
jgi:hypothetical protein